MIYEYFDEQDRARKREVSGSMKEPPPVDFWEGDTHWVRDFSSLVTNGDPVSGRYPYLWKSCPHDAASADCEKVKVMVGKQFRREVSIPLVKSKEHENMLRSKHNLVKE